LAFFFGFVDVDLDPFVLAFVDFDLLVLALVLVDLDTFEAVNIEKS